MLLHHLLTLLIGLPVIGAVGVLLLSNDKEPINAKLCAMIIATLELLLCIPLYARFDFERYTMQFTEKVSWIPQLGIDYSLGIDGISLALILLATFTTFIIVLAAWRMVKEQVANYLAAFLLLQAAMVGIFAACDAMLFYIFWEALLIPMYLVIGMWGHTHRAYAAMKFFLYTFLGSALMLVALLYLHQVAGSFDLSAMYQTKLTLTAQYFIFFAFFMAFAVKIPMWPVHTWLPDAHTEAPAGGSVLLAAVMLKMGAYGFLRFSLPIAPDACANLAWFMIALSLIAIVYIGFVALVQEDMKRLIAYSSISHMGIVTLGCFLTYLIARQQADWQLAMQGAVVQMLSHAFTASAMFIGVGIIYDRLHTRQISDLGGIVNTMPVFCGLFYVVCHG